MDDYNQGRDNFKVEFEQFINFVGNDSDEETEEAHPGSAYESIDSLMLPDITVYPWNSKLGFEDKQVIESCSVEDLGNLLVANRAKRIKLIQLYKRVKDLLKECQENIRIKELYLNKMIDSFSESHPQPNVWKLSAPYFKDKHLFPSPQNCDTVLKRSSGELSIYKRGPPFKWRQFECDILTKAVPLNYNLNRQKDKQRKILNLKFQISQINGSSKTKNELKRKLEMLEKELELLKTVSDNDVPPLNCNSFISWLRISNFFLGAKHSSLECKSFWNNYMHPSINRNDWTQEENKKAIALAEKYGYQNWEKIAEELQTGRTAFTVCVHYCSVLSEKCRKEKFTQEEDRLLLEVVDKCKFGDTIMWHHVAQYFADRSRPQLFHRYQYFLTADRAKGVKFTDAEDVLLLILVQRFGKDFTKCAKYFPNRSYMQLKNRFNSNLQMDIKKGTWSTEEDQAILKYVEENRGKSWTALTESLNRSRGQLRQRYCLLKRALAENPEMDVANLPKRKHPKFKKEEGRYNFLKYIAEKYKDLGSIPTLEAIQNCLGVGDKNRKNVKHLDAMLEGFFNTADKKTENVSNGNLVQICSGVDQNSVSVEDIDSELENYFRKFDARKELVASGHTSNDKFVNGAIFILKELKVHLESYVTSSGVKIELDETDSKILEHILLKQPNTSFLSKINSFIPPNINTLTGAKSILTNYKSHKAKQKKVVTTAATKCEQNKLDNDILWSIENNLAKQDEDKQKKIISDRNLFIERFRSLFYWPCVFSEENPCDMTNQCSANVSEKPSSSNVMKRNIHTVSCEYEPEQKIMKVEISTDD